MHGGMHDLLQQLWTYGWVRTAVEELTSSGPLAYGADMVDERGSAKVKSTLDHWNVTESCTGWVRLLTGFQTSWTIRNVQPSIGPADHGYRQVLRIV